MGYTITTTCNSGNRALISILLAGDDILQGGPGADYFDCGDGVDTVVDYNPSEGDIVSINCENVNSVHSSSFNGKQSVPSKPPTH